MKLLLKLEGSLKEEKAKHDFCCDLAPVVEKHMDKRVFISFDRNEQRLIDAKTGACCTLSWIKQTYGTKYQLLHILTTKA